jgi:hypothetical protein
MSPVRSGGLEHDRRDLKPHRCTLCTISPLHASEGQRGAELRVLAARLRSTSIVSPTSVLAF